MVAFQNEADEVMSGRRLALIVASFEYEDTGLRQLVAPPEDARALTGVLGDPAVGGFRVETLLNEPSHLVKRHVEAFFSDRQRDDLLLLYFSGHGIKDEEGRLYFGTSDTRRQLLRSTAVSASFVNDVMRYSESRRQILLLDCCYSGAFARGMVAKADSSVGTKERFEGVGRMVLTASDAVQYAFEGDRLTGSALQSVFTRLLIEGIKSGDADQNNDGRISFDELYRYIHSRANDETPAQRPRRWAFDVEGDLYIAVNTNQRHEPSDASKLSDPSVKYSRLPAPSEDVLDRHFDSVTRMIAEGRVIYHLGDSVNVAGRPLGVSWMPGESEVLPSYAELAAHLARHFGYADRGTQDLTQVSQYIADVNGSGELYDELHRILAGEYPPTPVHSFFAILPAILRAKKRSVPHPFIVTMNYDDALERAFQAQGEFFDLLWFMSDGYERGKFVHTRANGSIQIIDIPNQYGSDCPSLKTGTVILKPNGSLLPQAELNSFGHGHFFSKSALNMLPVQLMVRLRKNHHLFLGTTLHDWSWRTFFSSMFGDAKLTDAWAVFPNSTVGDEKMWASHGVQLLSVDLEGYLADLTKRLLAMPSWQDG